jgi:hypothetical protein
MEPAVSLADSRRDRSRLSWVTRARETLYDPEPETSLRSGTRITHYASPYALPGALPCLDLRASLDLGSELKEEAFGAAHRHVVMAFFFLRSAFTVGDLAYVDIASAYPLHLYWLQAESGGWIQEEFFFFLFSLLHETSQAADLSVQVAGSQVGNVRGVARSLGVSETECGGSARRAQIVMKSFTIGIPVVVQLSAEPCPGQNGCTGI